MNETEEPPTKVRRLNEIPRNEPSILTRPEETSSDNWENVVNVTYANNDIAASAPINPTYQSNTNPKYSTVIKTMIRMEHLNIIYYADMKRVKHNILEKTRVIRKLSILYAVSSS